MDLFQSVAQAFSEKKLELFEQESNALPLSFLKFINNSSRENKENHHCDRGLDMCSKLP